MHYKRYRPIILTLLITINITAMEKTELISPRNIIVFSALAIVSVALLFKVKTLITRYFKAYFPGQNTVNITKNITNNELIINGNGYSDQDLALLSLITPSGIVQNLPLDPIEHVAVFGGIGTVYINDEQTPRIEIDEAFNNNLVFTVKNGLLAVTTPDNKPRKFAYNGQALCTIYAKLLTTKLIASNFANVNIVNQNMTSIESANYSSIAGSTRPTENLKLKCADHAHLNITDIDCKTLAVTSSDFATAKVCGSITTNHDIAVNNHASYSSTLKNTCGKTILHANNFATVNLNGSTQSFETTINNHSKISAIGTTGTQNITVSNFGTFDGKQLNGTEAQVCLNNFSKAYINAQNNLRGSLCNFSKLTYTGKPRIDIKKDSFSKYSRE